MPLSIKICGITSIQDAENAILAGATHIGMIFVPNTPRCINIETAQDISKKVGQRAIRVGVFQDQSLESIRTIQKQIPLDMIQLHGNETPQEIAQFDGPVIKVITLTPQTQLAQIKPFLTANTQTLLLDLPKGSTDTLENVLHADLITQIKALGISVWVAGKLTPENVFSTLKKYHPHGVDCASGVESSPGIKDTTHLNRFCQTIQAFQNQTEEG